MCVLLALTLLVATRAASQETGQHAQDTTQWDGPQWTGHGSPPANAALPVPLVIVGMASPTREADWQHYPLVEDCNALFERSLRAEIAPLVRDTLRDTTRARNTPVPPAVIAVGRGCLSRFPLSTLSDTVLGSTLPLAIALDEDTLIRPIVVRQLAYARAQRHSDGRDVLDAAIGFLLANPVRSDARGHLRDSASHFQLARAYTEQLDALGNATLSERAARRERLLEPAEAAGDIPMERTLRQELQQLLHDVPIDTTDLWYRKWDNDLQLAKLDYAQSLSHDDVMRLAAVLKTRDDLTKRVAPSMAASMGHASRFLGAPFPALACNYRFDSPKGSVASAPPSDRSALFFYDADWANTEALERNLKALRRLHAALPTLPITLGAMATEIFADRSFKGHSDQEAQWIHQYITDSLRAPGSVCVITADTETVANGRVITEGISAAMTAIVDQGPLFIADPTGTVVYNGGNIFNSGSIEKPYGVDLVEFIRRLRAQFPASGEAPAR